MQFARATVLTGLDPQFSAPHPRSSYRSGPCRPATLREDQVGNKILLIDDSVTVQKIITLTFSDEGVDVVTVDSGDEAINRLAYLRPAIVMADVSIPGRNGYDVCAYIKGTEELKHIPVILLVPGFETYDAERARRVGADYHLTKPFQSIRSLITTVKGLMGTVGSGSLSSAEAGVVPNIVDPADNLLELGPADTGPLVVHGSGGSRLPEEHWRPGTERSVDLNQPLGAARSNLSQVAEGPVEPENMVDNDQRQTEQTRPLSSTEFGELIERIAARIGAQLAEESARTRAAITDRIDALSAELAASISSQVSAQLAEVVRRQITEGARKAPAALPELPVGVPRRFEDPDRLLELDDL